MVYFSTVDFSAITRCLPSCSLLEVVLKTGPGPDPAISLKGHWPSPCRASLQASCLACRMQRLTPGAVPIAGWGNFTTLRSDICIWHLIPPLYLYLLQMTRYSRQLVLIPWLRIFMYCYSLSPKEADKMLLLVSSPYADLDPRVAAQTTSSLNQN